jgi:hypothetical protein
LISPPIASGWKKRLRCRETHSSPRKTSLGLCFAGACRGLSRQSDVTPSWRSKSAMSRLMLAIAAGVRMCGVIRKIDDPGGRSVIAVSSVPRWLPGL